MKQLTDIALVAQTILGSDRAFETLVERHQSVVRRLLLQLTGGDTMTSDDLAQETFIKAYTHIRSFKSLSSFSSWLYRIAYNTFYDYIRMRKLTEEIDSPSVVALHASGANPDRAMDVQQALRNLSGEVRMAVVLYYMEDMKVVDVAEVMNCPVGTVKSHLYKGREQLSQFFKAEGYETVH